MAQARTLGDSLRRTNPNVKFVIGLVDRLGKANLPKDKIPDYELLELHKIGIHGLDEMCKNYDITELNTAVKPYFFRYFFEKAALVRNVIYFDPDIIVYQPLTDLEASLEKYNFVVTPHITKPINDNFSPNELNHLNTGIFNFGFIALHKSPQANEFIKWWEEKLFNECKIDLCNGLFVDQNWGNFIPYFWESVKIEKHPGYNAAYWNLTERVFSVQENQHFVNNNFSVVFFHYSGYNIEKETVISKYQNRYDFINRPDLIPLFKFYKDELTRNHNAYYRQFGCFYIKTEPEYRFKRVRKILTQPFREILKRL